MARTLTVPARDYVAGNYGPFRVDGFVRGNTDWLELMLTVEAWPAASPILTGAMRWDGGDGVDFAISHPSTERDGTPRTIHRVRVGVPQTPSGKAAVTSGTITLALALPIRTALTLTAGADPA